MLILAEGLRDRQRSLLEAARRGEVLPTDDLERLVNDCDDIILWLSERDAKIADAAETLSHRINNLLMAVQTTCDYLAVVPGNDGLDRLRERMIAAIASGQSALQEARSVLFELR